MATTRLELRASLQRKTDQKLTASADQDIYLNLAELAVISDWRKFDPGLFRAARDSASTDASGILLLDADFSRLERLEDANKTKYEFIDNVNDIWTATGYYFEGYDSTNFKRQVKVMRAGTALASTTLYWFNIKLIQMGSTSAGQPVIPEEYRDALAMKATELYWRDQGPSFANFANYWAGEYDRMIVKAERWYKNVSTDPSFIESYDPDAGGAGLTRHVS
jgi:hypothetical protein